MRGWWASCESLLLLLLLLLLLPFLLLLCLRMVELHLTLPLHLEVLLPSPPIFSPHVSISLLLLPYGVVTARRTMMKRREPTAQRTVVRVMSVTWRLKWRLLRERSSSRLGRVRIGL